MSFTRYNTTILINIFLIYTVYIVSLSCIIHLHIYKHSYWIIDWQLSTKTFTLPFVYRLFQSIFDLKYIILKALSSIMLFGMKWSSHVPSENHSTWITALIGRIATGHYCSFQQQRDFIKCYFAHTLTLVFSSCAF